MGRFLEFLKIVFLLAVAAMADPAGQGVDVDPGDPEVHACAAFAVESFNRFYHDPHVYQITEIKSVRRLNVGGGQYEINLEVRKTEDLKENRSNPKPKEPTNREGPEVIQCYFSVLSSKWRNQRTLLRSSCH
ncbi:cystatin-1-like [Triplophysa dalaica]|uniref:cystatin-1-like n=1 Tax=Triplophysa dalaica TaxID=1582913 RepID=UPI0024DFB7EA|nr:cystatin-1-like [Triplophysa dalaica]